MIESKQLSLIGTFLVWVLCSVTHAAPEPPVENIQLRYRKGKTAKLRHRFPPARVNVQSDMTRIAGDRAQVQFNRKTGAVDWVKIRERKFAQARIADMEITDLEGRTFFQRRGSGLSSRPALSEPRDEGLYIVQSGTFVPRTQDGRVLSPVEVEYRTHRYTGYTFVSHVFPRGLKNVRRIVVRNTLGKGSEDLDGLHTSGHWWGSVRQMIPSTRVGIVKANPSTLQQYAIWANGRMGIEVDGMEFGHWPVHESFSRSDGESYITVRVHPDGTRAVDAYYVHQPEGQSVDLDPGSRFRLGFSILPFRRYRPVSELYGGWCKCDNPRPWNHERMLEAAKRGVTMTMLENWNTSIDDIPHRYGIKTVFYTSGIILWRNNQYANPPYALDGPELERDYLTDYHGTTPKNMDKNLGMCPSAPEWRQRSVNHWRQHALKNPNLDYLYTDDNYGAFLCDNKGHGCDQRQMGPGMTELNDDYQLMLEELPNDRAFIIHPAQWPNASFAHGDFLLPGEDSHHLDPEEPDVARRIDHDLIMTSLLFGNQCIYYTWSMGRLPARASKLWVYEMALTRCATVMSPQEPLLAYTREDEDVWSRYMSPLVIYDIEKSEVHHPFDHEFPSYASVDVEGVTPVLYSRPGDLLVVVAKETRESKPATVTLSLKSLKFPGREVLVYDSIERKLQRLSADESDRLALENLRVDRGPQLLRVVALPKKPTELWHGPETWKVEITELATNALLRKMIDIKVEGTPTATGELLVYTGGRPTSVSGGTLVEYDEKLGVAKLTVDFPLDAKASMKLAF